MSKAVSAKTRPDGTCAGGVVLRMRRDRLQLNKAMTLA